VEHGSTNNRPEAGDSVEHGSTESRAEPGERDIREERGSTVTIIVGAGEGGFYVADDGPGIPAGKRDVVFEPGYSTRADGTGLGLAIVERIVTAHGWDLTLTTGAAGGVRFEIEVETDD
jgi:signal transduction histidine kinase